MLQRLFEDGTRRHARLAFVIQAARKTAVRTSSVLSTVVLFLPDATLSSLLNFVLRNLIVRLDWAR